MSRKSFVIKVDFRGKYQYSQVIKFNTKHRMLRWQAVSIIEKWLIKHRDFQPDTIENRAKGNHIDSWEFIDDVINVNLDDNSYEYFDMRGIINKNE